MGLMKLKRDKKSVPMGLKCLCIKSSLNCFYQLHRSALYLDKCFGSFFKPRRGDLCLQEGY